MCFSLFFNCIIPAYLNCNKNIHFLLSRVNSINPLEDIQFGMYVDVEVAQLIRILDKKKQKAVSCKKEF